MATAAGKAVATTTAAALLRRTARRPLLHSIPVAAFTSSRQHRRMPPPPTPQGVESIPALGRSDPSPAYAAARGGVVRDRIVTPSRRLSARRRFSSEAPSGEGEGGKPSRERAATQTGPAIALGSRLAFKTIVDGKPMLPKDFEGKAVLVVNTASLCGLTPQLKELELVHKRFSGEGLVVLGIPSNDFGGQEPWDEEKIREFYAKDFGVTFPLTSKTVVVGQEAHPLYSAVIAEFGQDVGPQWNFHKLLVGADGALAGVFGSNLSPLEPDMTEAIEEALPAKPGPST